MCFAILAKPRPCAFACGQNIPFEKVIKMTTTTKPSWGGKRRGAGRKPVKRLSVKGRKRTPLQFMLAAMNDTNASDRLRLERAGCMRLTQT